MGEQKVQRKDGVGPRSEDSGPGGGASADLKEKPLTWILLSQLLGVSLPGLRLWRQRAGAPTEPDLAAWQEFVKKEQLGNRTSVLAGSELKQEKTRHEIELLKAKISREQRRVIDRDEVNQLLLHIATRSRTMLYQFLETELAPKLDGMSAAQMRPILRETADTIADMQAELAEQFNRQ